MAGEVIRLGGALESRVEVREGVTYVALVGVIDEAADLAPVTRLPGPMVVDLSELRRINSVGVRCWMDFVRAREATRDPRETLTFERCSPAMVSQMSMITRFMGARSRVASVLVPYRCTSCGADHLEPLTVATNVQVQPTRSCSKCQARMELDELVETYAEALEHAG
ncbi:hypothetical protein BH11MYX1_BH11MYX1_45860 [soil metagenome]